jgi:hypothetical protein
VALDYFLTGSGCALATSVRTPFGVATVRRYAQERRRELGLSGEAVFVPQSHEQANWPGTQVDRFEGMATLA